MKLMIYALMSVLAISGLISVGVRFSEGMKVTALSSSIPWGMWVVFYIYFVGLSAGMYLIASLPYVFGIKKLERIGPLAILCSIVSLITGMVFIGIDLGHPFRFWKVITNFNPSSVLAWEFMLYLVFLVILLLTFWYLKRCDLADQTDNSTGLKKSLAGILSLGFKCPRTPDQYNVCHLTSLKIVKLIAFIGIPIVLLVRGGTGALFAVVVARPHWFGGLLPVVFLVSGLLSAVSMLLFIYGIFNERNEETVPVFVYLRNLLLLFLTIESFLLISESLVGLYSNIPERMELYHQVMFGPFPYIFWVGQLGLGVLIPVLISIFPGTKNSPGALTFAGLSCSCGVVSIILNLVIPAYVLPMLKGLDTAFIDSRLKYFYFPSLIEWLSSFGLISFFSLFFIVLIKNLPVLTELRTKFEKGVVR